MKHSEIFSYNIKLLRLQKNISAKDLSYELNMPLNRIGDIENGRMVNIKQDEINQIASYFAVSALDIYTKKAKVTFQ